MLYARRRIVVLLPLLALAGCTPLPQGKSPLMPTQMSPDSVVLDMFFVRFPFGDPAVNEKLWEQIDEQQFAPDLRERLAQNGFRVGVVSGQMPVATVEADGAERQAGRRPAGWKGSKLNSLEAEPRVVRRHVQTRAGQPTEILASSVYPELTVLLRRSDQLSGETYQLAQGVFTAKAFPQPDGRTRLQLVPELQHDQPGSAGTWAIRACCDWRAASPKRSTTT